MQALFNYLGLSVDSDGDGDVGQQIVARPRSAQEIAKMHNVTMTRILNIDSGRDSLGNDVSAAGAMDYQSVTGAGRRDGRPDAGFATAITSSSNNATVSLLTRQLNAAAINEARAAQGVMDVAIPQPTLPLQVLEGNEAREATQAYLDTALGKQLTSSNISSSLPVDSVSSRSLKKRVIVYIEPARESLLYSSIEAFFTESIGRELFSVAESMV